MRAARNPAAPRAHRERGATLIELMVTVVVMMIVMAGVLSFFISQAQMGTTSIDRSDIQRGGRAALSILEEKIQTAGLGLPQRFAIKSFGTETCGTVQTQTLVVASLDFRRQWSVAATTGSTNNGTLTLVSAAPDPGGTSDDTVINLGRWVYLYQSGVNDNAGHAGYGLGQVAVRTKTNINVTVNSTVYSAAQSQLDLATTSAFNNSTTNRATAMLLADVAGFGVDCTDAAHPYLYWDDNGVRQPVASNVDTRTVTLAEGDLVGLRFRFLLDTDADGVADSTATTLAFNADPATANNDNVVAIEVLLRLRSESQDPQLKAYRTEDFVRIIRLQNVNTTVSEYIFIGNGGI